MAKQTRTRVNPQNDPDITWRGTYSLEQREAMLREAAYYRYAERGYTDGHDLDDWLAAEAELEGGTRPTQEIPPEKELQLSGIHGPAKDDKLKQMVKQHPQKAISQIESVEPEKAPFKE